MKLPLFQPFSAELQPCRCCFHEMPTADLFFQLPLFYKTLSVGVFFSVFIKHDPLMCFL
jgi:hypothetical protein